MRPSTRPYRISLGVVLVKGVFMKRYFWQSLRICSWKKPNLATWIEPMPHESLRLSWTPSSLCLTRSTQVCILQHPSNIANKHFSQITGLNFAGSPQLFRTRLRFVTLKMQDTKCALHATLSCAWFLIATVISKCWSESSLTRSASEIDARPDPSSDCSHVKSNTNLNSICSVALRYLFWITESRHTYLKFCDFVSPR